MRSASDCSQAGAQPAAPLQKPRQGREEAAFQAAVPQEMGIDGAVKDREAQLRRELVFQLFPDKFGVRFFDFHR